MLSNVDVLTTILAKPQRSDSEQKIISQLTVRDIGYTTEYLFRTEKKPKKFNEN